MSLFTVVKNYGHMVHMGKIFGGKTSKVISMDLLTFSFHSTLRIGVSIHQLRITTSMFWLFESVMSRRRLSAIFWAMQGTIPNFGRQSLTLVGRIFSLEIFHILWILLFYTPTLYAMLHWNAFDTFFEMEMSAAWQLVGKKSWLFIDWEEVYLQFI